MGIGAFRGEPSQDPGPGPETAHEAMGSGGLVTFIDEGSEFEGTLRLKHGIRIDGDFRGEIASEDTVIVGEGAGIEASIHSRNVIIRGAVAGDVVATRQLVVHKTGRLLGDVETPCLSIEPGALFNGRTKMVRPELLLRGHARTQAAPEAPRPEPSPRPS